MKVGNKKFNVNNKIFPEHLREVELGRWEPHTFKIFDTFLDKEHSFLDIGAWIGITTLYGAHNARHCYAIEPDPIAFKYLQENVQLNPQLQSKITLSNQCLHTYVGTTSLGNRWSKSGGDSGSSVLDLEKAQVTWTVPCTTFEQFLLDYKIADYNFIKMDIEGAEALLLPQMEAVLKRDKPTLYLSLHPPYYGKSLETALLGIIQVLNHYEHLYTAEGQEIYPFMLMDDEVSKHFFEVVATDRHLIKPLFT